MEMMNRTDILNLVELSKSNEVTPITNIPQAFKSDFDIFFFGKTLTREGVILCAYPTDIKAWVRFVFNKYS